MKGHLQKFRSDFLGKSIYMKKAKKILTYNRKKEKKDNINRKFDVFKVAILYK